MAQSDNSLTLTAVAAQITTIGAARAALGKVSEVLREAYGRLDAIGGGAGSAIVNLGTGALDEVKEAARQRLDVVNAYAQGIYATIGTSDPDLQGEEIGALTCARIGLVLAQAQDALKDVENAADETYWDFASLIRDSLAESGAIAGTAIQKLTNGIAAGGAALVASAWPTILAVGVGVAAYLWVRAGRPKLIGGG